MNSPYFFDNVPPVRGEREPVSLRDYFAAKAMQMEMLSARQRYDSDELEADDWKEAQTWVAEYAYDMADAMLAARDAK